MHSANLSRLRKSCSNRRSSRSIAPAESAGRCRLEKAVPLLVRRLEEVGDDIQDEIGAALTRIGGVAVIQAVARKWWQAGPDARMTLCEPLALVHCELAAERARTFFAKETDPDVRMCLVRAILGQFDPRGIEVVRQCGLELDESPDRSEVRAALVAASLIMEWSFPELDDWQRDAMNDEWSSAHRYRMRLSKALRGVFLEDPTVAYQIKVCLQRVDPPVWRRLEVRDCDLCRLHGIIQVAMGWEDTHLYAFTVGDERYADPVLMEHDPDFASGRMIHLSDLFTRAGQCFLYEYDFGDGWRHEILVEEIVDVVRGQSYPRCVAGERACPPEDVGGPSGYADYLVALADLGHEEHDEWLRWRGEFDPDAFDLDGTNRRLESLATPDGPLIDVWPSGVRGRRPTVPDRAHDGPPQTAD